MKLINQWVSFNRGRVKKATKLSPKEFAMIYRGNPTAIIRSVFVLPTIGSRGFGHFKVILSDSTAIPQHSTTEVTPEGMLVRGDDPRQLSLF